MKVEIKGIVKAISGVTASVTKKNEQLQYATISVIKPAFVNEYGEKKGSDSVYEFKLFNEKIKLIGDLAPGNKVHINGYLNSSVYTSADGKTGYNLYLNLTDIKKI